MVFISYSSKDEHIIRDIVNYLKSENIECWIYKKNQIPGTIYSKNIVDAIKKSKVFLLFLSNNSNNSTMVLNEVAEAATSEKPILTYKLEDIEPSKELKLFISIYYWIDGFEDNNGKKSLDKLKISINNLLEKKKIENLESKNLHIKSKRKFNLWLLLPMISILGFSYYIYIQKNIDNSNDNDIKKEMYTKLKSRLIQNREDILRSKLRHIVVSNDEFDEKSAKEEMEYFLKIAKFNEETQMKFNAPFVWSHRCKKAFKNPHYYNFSKKPYKEKSAKNYIETCSKATTLNPKNLQLKYLLAISYHKNQEYAKTLKILKELAYNDFAQAQRELGIIYFLGDIVKKDIQKAKNYLMKAAENGDKASQKIIEENLF
jgi:hypothetical protein